MTWKTLRWSMMIGAATAMLSFGFGTAAGSVADEDALLEKINAARAAGGKTPLQLYWDLTDDARAHSGAMASSGELFHNPDLGSVTTGWNVLGENLGVGPDVDAVFDAFMDSAGHRANILGSYDYAGVGVVDEGDKIWVTIIFMDGDALFVDISTSIFVHDILWLTEDGTRFACNPPDDDLFCPDADVERETMAEFVATTLSLPPASRDYFIDDESSPYEDSINRLAAAGITYGCNPPANDMFCPDRILNRGEMAAFFVRALGLTDDGEGDYFIDGRDSVFNHDMDKLFVAGITYGCNPPDNTMYCPDRLLNRGEISAFLHRALG